MQLLNRIAIFIVVLSLAYVSSSAQNKATQKTPETKPTPTPTPMPTTEPLTATLRPTILYREEAKYTETARNNGVEGMVVLQVVFRIDGAITDIKVVRGLPDGLTESAIEAVKKIRFQPAMKNGQPVSVRGHLEYVFNLFNPLLLTSPEDGAVFSHSPRKLTLKWKSDPQATVYRVRIDQGNSDSNEWSKAQQLEIAETEYVFYFPGAQPGRWKIEALQSDGKVLAVSEWRYFRFTK